MNFLERKNKISVDKQESQPTLNLKFPNNENQNTNGFAGEF